MHWLRWLFPKRTPPTIPSVTLTQEQFLGGQLIEYCVVVKGKYYWYLTTVVLGTPYWKALEKIHCDGDRRLICSSQCFESCCVSSLQLVPCRPGERTVFFEARSTDLIWEQRTFGRFVEKVREAYV